MMALRHLLAGALSVLSASAAAGVRVEAVPPEAGAVAPSPAASLRPVSLGPSVALPAPAVLPSVAPSPVPAAVVPAAAAAPARAAAAARPAAPAALAGAAPAADGPGRSAGTGADGEGRAESRFASSELWDGARARRPLDDGSAVAAAAPSPAAVRLDPAQSSLIKNHQTFTRGRGFGDYVRLFDGSFGGPGPFARAVAALKGRPDARWLDSGGGEGLATAELMRAPGYEGLTTTLVSYETSAEAGPRRRVLAGRFLQDIPPADLGSNHLVTDVIGVLAYTYDFMADFRKLYQALAPGGELFVYFGSSRRDFFGKDNLVVSGGKVLPLAEYLATIPGLEYELVKTPLYDNIDGSLIGEVWNARVRRAAGASPEWPEFETLYFKEGDRTQGEIVPRRMFKVKGEPGPSPALTDALAARARAAYAGRGAEALFDAFRGYSGLTNPLLNRLLRLGRGQGWAVEGPSAPAVARDLREGVRFRDPAFWGPAQRLMGLLARAAARKPLVAVDARPAVLVVDDGQASYRFSEDLARWVAGAPDGGEVWVALGLLKGGAGTEARVLRRDGSRGDLYDWVATVPGLKASFHFGHRFDGRVHQEPAYMRIVVPDRSKVRIPALELLGVGAASADGVPTAYYRER